jgi:hypothetical protein
MRKVLWITLVILVSIFSVVVIGLCVYFREQAYQFFSSPLWSSAGVIVGGLGVFFGAKYGAKLGIKSTLELNKELTTEESNIKFRAFRREVIYNSMTIDEMEKFLNFIDGPSPLSFNSMKIASNHIQRGAWEEFLKVGSYNQFSLDLIIACIDFQRVLNEAIRDIQMNIADWERLCELNLNTEEFNQKFIEIKKNIFIKIENVKEQIQKIDQKELSETD